jgi:hypothetical protein
MLNRKLMFSLVALIGFGLFFTLNAFKKTEKAKTIQYQYISNSTLAADIKDVANWEEVASSTPSCGNAGNLVCRFDFEGDMQDFGDFLDLSSTTPEYLRNNAVAKKQ